MSTSELMIFANFQKRLGTENLLGCGNCLAPDFVPNFQIARGAIHFKETNQLVANAN
jgi:hypothetical protein